MKKFCITLLLVSLMAVAFTSCSSTRSVTSTKSNDGYIQIIGDKTVYSETVIITVDNKASYEIDVNDITNLTIKNPATYAIAPGAHMIEIEYNGVVVLNKKIFISSQEINVVELPWRN